MVFSGTAASSFYRLREGGEAFFIELGFFELGQIRERRVGLYLYLLKPVVPLRVGGVHLSIILRPNCALQSALN